jgi:hypothetical protein
MRLMKQTLDPMQHGPAPRSGGSTGLAPLAAERFDQRLEGVPLKISPRRLLEDDRERASVPPIQHHRNMVALSATTFKLRWGGF